MEVRQDHQTTNDLWRALTRGVDLDSEKHSAVELRQIQINRVLCNACMLKRYN